MPSDDSVRRILQAVDRVEERLPGAVPVGRMAEAACYSLYHFIRVFNALTWQSPYDYAMRRRLSVSVNRLILGEHSILDIALEFGFESPEGYSRAVRKAFGSRPSAIRRNGGVDDRLLTPPFNRELLDALASCRYTGTTELDGDVSVPVTVDGTGGEPGEALAQAAAVGGDEAFQAALVVDAGCRQVVRAGSGPYRMVMPAGVYHQVEVRGAADRLRVLPDLADAVFRPFLGAVRPTDRLFVRVCPGGFEVLLPRTDAAAG